MAEPVLGAVEGSDRLFVLTSVLRRRAQEMSKEWEPGIGEEGVRVGGSDGGERLSDGRDNTLPQERTPARRSACLLDLANAGSIGFRSSKEVGKKTRWPPAA